jgi:long-chain acyl-CoA synthetase
MKIIQPSFFAGVPRVYNVFKERIDEEVRKKGRILSFIYDLAVKYKIYRQRKGIYSSWILDKLIFNRIRNEFGGRVRSMLSGSAPLDPSVCAYLQAVFSCRIFQGYGQTEATAANIVVSSNCHENGVVGIPFPVNLVKLAKTSEYDGIEKGEVCLKGNNIMKGYFKRDDLTREAFDDEGWLMTGDIGRVNDAIFEIIGRRKDIFKTSLGEYIIPEKIENIYKGGIIEDILITGRPYGDYIVGIVVCKDNSISPKMLHEKIMKVGDEHFRKGMITKFEIPRRIHVLRCDFSRYGEFLTPTGKAKRSLIERYFSEEIDKMYVE